MADVFNKDDVIALIKDKHTLFIGDSNIRALYKDVVWLYNNNTLIGHNFLKKRLENSFLGDKLIERSELTRGRDFSEHRIFEDKHTKIEFFFVTKCYCKKLINFMNDVRRGVKHCPDVILMNSCLWDITRWGPNGVTDYKENMNKLMKLVSSSLPKRVLFIWATALPIATQTYGGLIIKQEPFGYEYSVVILIEIRVRFADEIVSKLRNSSVLELFSNRICNLCFSKQKVEFLQAVLRIHVIEANNFTAGLVSSYGFDVLDFHHHMRYQIIRRSSDGVHFLPPAVRFLTNLLMTHISLSWDVKLPGNLRSFSSPLATTIERAIEASKGDEVQLAIKKIEKIVDAINEKNSDILGHEKRTSNCRKGEKALPFNVRKKVSKKSDPKQVQTQNRNSMPRRPPFYRKSSLPQHQRWNRQFNHKLQAYIYNDNYQDNNSNMQRPCTYKHQQNFLNNYSSYVDCNNIPFHPDLRSSEFDNFNQGSRGSASCHGSGPSLKFSHYVYDSFNTSAVQGNTSVTTAYQAQHHQAGMQLSVSIIDNLSSSYNANNRYLSYEDRFLNYQRHPYKSQWYGWQDRPPRREMYQNIGPVRQNRRVIRYNQRYY